LLANMININCGIDEANFSYHCHEVKLIYKGYGSIKKKLEIHGIPLKRELTKSDKRMDVVVESIPTEDSNDRQWPSYNETIGVILEDK